MKLFDIGAAIIIVLLVASGYVASTDPKAKSTLTGSTVPYVTTTEK